MSILYDMQSDLIGLPNILDKNFYRKDNKIFDYKVIYVYLKEDKTLKRVDFSDYQEKDRDKVYCVVHTVEKRKSSIRSINDILPNNNWVEIPIKNGLFTKSFKDNTKSNIPEFNMDVIINDNHRTYLNDISVEMGYVYQ